MPMPKVFKRDDPLSKDFVEEIGRGKTGREAAKVYAESIEASLKDAMPVDSGRLRDSIGVVPVLGGPRPRIEIRGEGYLHALEDGSRSAEGKRLIRPQHIVRDTLKAERKRAEAEAKAVAREERRR